MNIIYKNGLQYQFILWIARPGFIETRTGECGVSRDWQSKLAAVHERVRLVPKPAVEVATAPRNEERSSRLLVI